MLVCWTKSCSETHNFKRFFFTSYCVKFSNTLSEFVLIQQRLFLNKLSLNSADSTSVCWGPISVWIHSLLLKLAIYQAVDLCQQFMWMTLVQPTGLLREVIKLGQEKSQRRKLFAAALGVRWTFTNLATRIQLIETIFPTWYWPGCVVLPSQWGCSRELWKLPNSFLLLT